MTNIIIPESAYELRYTLNDVLFPKIKPNKEGYLRVSDTHELWCAEYGNPEGLPVVVLHGGPGAGCSNNDMRFFDPKFYRIILFDQRGSKRSRPECELVENNTQNLVDDIEKIRKHLKVDKWLIFGGSWGSTLALLYGETHPDRCLGFVLQGVFLARMHEIQNVFKMQDIFPDLYDEFKQFIPENERRDLLKAYHKRLYDSDNLIAIEASNAFVKYDIGASCLMNGEERVQSIIQNEGFLLPMSRFFTHYCVNNFFIKENQIIEDLQKIAHLPSIIIQGRYDIICRPQSAYELYKSWRGSELLMIQDAGHTSAEPGIAKGLVYATEKMRKRFFK